MVCFRRMKIPGGIYFFTVALRDRKSKLLVEHINILGDAMRMTCQKYPFTIHAVVVLPEHIHAIWELPAGDDDYSNRWRRIKHAFTHGIITKGVKLHRDCRGEYNLWRRRFWEHAIRNDYDMEKHVNYIHYNPVKHRLVNRADEWPYSSIHRYLKNQKLPFDWESKLIDADIKQAGE